LNQVSDNEAKFFEEKFGADSFPKATPSIVDQMML
jgi:hypothetical protein